MPATPGSPATSTSSPGRAPTPSSREEQLAFWINVYNAYTIQLVNAHGERKSIRNINKTLGAIKAVGPWKQEIVRAGGQTMSLDHVEHEIIRKRFREPRIHFALVCAARSCPPLRREAYTGGRLDAQLDAQARIFIAGSPDKNRVDVASSTVYLSPIFTWFKEDFGLDLGRFLARYVPDGPERRLLEGGTFKTVETDVRLVAERHTLDTPQVLVHALGGVAALRRWPRPPGTARAACRRRRRRRARWSSCRASVLGHVAAGVELDAELVEHARALRAQEAHGQQHQVAGRSARAGDLLHREAAVVASTHSMRTVSIAFDVARRRRRRSAWSVTQYSRGSAPNSAAASSWP